MRSSIVLGSAVATVLAGWGALATRAQSAGPLRFAISFPAARSAQPLDGRVLLFISDDGRTAPKTQSDQYRANSTRPISGVDVDRLEPGRPVVIDHTIVGWPARSLKDIPAGEYFVQALLNRYETFRRSDGHTIKIPMDQEIPPVAHPQDTTQVKYIRLQNDRVRPLEPVGPASAPD